MPFLGSFSRISGHTGMADFDSRAKGWDEVPGRVERAQAVAAAIRGQVALSSRMSTLEYGCGTGLLSFALQADLGSITLADSSAGMLEVVRQKIARGRITNMAPLHLDLAVDPVPPQRFDLIYSLMTLHHIPDTAGILGCFQTLLHPGGVLCIADLDKEDGSFHSHEPDFGGHNGFDHAELGLDLERAGFIHIRFGTCYTVIKGERHYPLFLAVAEKK
jgi:ubiquinone/menaquinone biosynthesis C-methylase UbiE